MPPKVIGKLIQLSFLHQNDGNDGIMVKFKNYSKKKKKNYTY